MGKSMNSNNPEDYGYTYNNLHPSAFFYTNQCHQQSQQSAQHHQQQTKANSASSLPTYAVVNAKNLQDRKTQEAKMKKSQAASNMRASSLGFDSNNQKFLIKQKAQPQIDQYPRSYKNEQPSSGTPYNSIQHQAQHFQQRSMSHFNHFNRASYKGECKRLMSRNNVETVAERAARFEDIDFERYNRLKAKYGELDLSQYENDFANQLQLQRYLRLNELNSARNGGGGLLNYMEPLDVKTGQAHNLNNHKNCK